MSDYISKSALIKELRKGQEVIKDKLDDISISGIYATIEAVIEEIDRHPTLDEKEIIRKPMERIIERLEEERKYSYENFKDEERAWRKGLRTAIKIVKEEGGIE